MNISALILAGGASRRMGFPKALLEFQGETFLDRLIRITGESCASVTVVLGAEAERIRGSLRTAERAQFVVNNDWERGQFSSLQAGLRAVQGSCDAFLFLPVDYPSIQPSTVAVVCGAWAQGADRPLFVVPRFQSRHGHPVLCDAGLIDEFLSLPADAQARDVVHKYVDRTVYVDVDDPGVLKDADDMRAYEELLAGQGPTA